MCAILVQHEAIKTGIHDDRTWQNVHDRLLRCRFSSNEKRLLTKYNPPFIWSRSTIRDFSRYRERYPGRQRSDEDNCYIDAYLSSINVYLQFSACRSLISMREWAWRFEQVLGVLGLRGTGDPDDDCTLVLLVGEVQ
ncbi:hypothetical protein PG984_000047 [Apiospora sp. TS-2023a]